MTQSNIDEIYEQVLGHTQVNYYIITCITIKIVTMDARDPSYVSPLIKSLLTKGNWLRRRR